MSRRTRRGRARRIFAASVAALVLLPVALLLLLRWIPPPVSALMIQRSLGKSSPSREHKWVGLSQMSPHLVVAVVAAEDQKFAEHHGFDREAIEAALAERAGDKRLRGASTITQQVAKNLFLWPGRNYLRKGLEAMWTVEIEMFWPKRRIVEVYLNIVEFGDGVFGVESASQKYFRKPASRISAPEAALLAAVLPNPHRFRVGAPSAYLRGRQTWIEAQMRQLGGPAYLQRLD